MNEYLIRVRYRTNSGVNAKDLCIDADCAEVAVKLASDRVRRMRGVIRIDSSEWTAPSHQSRNPWGQA